MPGGSRSRLTLRVAMLRLLRLPFLRSWRDENSRHPGLVAVAMLTSPMLFIVGPGTRAGSALIPAGLECRFPMADWPPTQDGSNGVRNSGSQKRRSLSGTVGLCPLLSRINASPGNRMILSGVIRSRAVMCSLDVWFGGFHGTWSNAGRRQCAFWHRRRPVPFRNACVSLKVVNHDVRDNALCDLAEMPVMGQIDYLPDLRHLTQEPEHLF